MLPYIIYFSFCSSLVLFQHDSKILYFKKLPLNWVFLFSVTVLFLGFREGVGGDWNSYLSILEHTRTSGLVDSLFITDPAYALLNWIASNIYGGIQLINTVCAFLFVGGICIFCRKQTDPFLAFIFAVPYLVLVVGMGYTRQSVAIGIVMCALSFLTQTKILRFLTLIVIAGLFHKTALLFFLLAFYYIKSSIKGIFIFLFIGLIYFVGYFDYLLDSYLNDQLHSSGAVLRGSILALSALIFFILRKIIIPNKDQVDLWSIISAASIFLFLIGLDYKYSTLADRFGLYLLPLQFLVFARLPYALKFNGSMIYAYKLAAIAFNFLILYLWFLYSPYSQKWVPYKTYLMGF